MSPFIAGVLTLSTWQAPVDAPVSALVAVQRATTPANVEAVVQRLVHADHWRDRNVVGQELVQHGESAAAAMLVLIQTTDDARLQREAFQWLRKHFPTHSLIRDYILSQGLQSPEFSIRYESLWHVGEHHWDESRGQLYTQMRDDNGEPYFRFVAAKSLAELGDQRALRTLIEAVRNDRYMPRYFGNLGLRTLTGKCLNDFGYNYGEGAFVSGGVEARMANPDPLATAETLARRHTACRDYLEWLRDQKPELYEALTTRF